VPTDVAAHLLEAFGHGYEAMYAAEKWENHWAGPTEPDEIRLVGIV